MDKCKMLIFIRFFVLYFSANHLFNHYINQRKWVCGFNGWWGEGAPSTIKSAYPYFLVNRSFNILKKVS
ncbi:MAG: hypothetical protein RBS14_06645, partial [Atribacterota bacterium]|nr:hypothetical protein [Atribacterota bacterium]